MFFNIKEIDDAEKSFCDKMKKYNSSVDNSSPGGVTTVDVGADQATSVTVSHFFKTLLIPVSEDLIKCIESDVNDLQIILSDRLTFELYENCVRINSLIKKLVSSITNFFMSEKFKKAYMSYVEQYDFFTDAKKIDIKIIPVQHLLKYPLFLKNMIKELSGINKLLVTVTPNVSEQQLFTVTDTQQRLIDLNTFITTINEKLRLPGIRVNVNDVINNLNLTDEEITKFALTDVFSNEDTTNNNAPLSRLNRISKFLSRKRRMHPQRRHESLDHDLPQDFFRESHNIGYFYDVFKNTNITLEDINKYLRILKNEYDKNINFQTNKQSFIQHVKMYIQYI
jgi:hypothetical protein